jgi:hypothetical protein
MDNDFQKRLPDSVRAVLRPLIRLLLRSGITYKQFAEIAKEAYVQESTLETDSRGRPTNTSRVAVRTALSRKEVARIRREIAEKTDFSNDQGDVTDRSSHAARVLQLWHSDPRFGDGTGKPRVLQVDGQSRSFHELVRLAGGDVPYGAVRAELIAAGAIEELGGGGLRVLKRHFIPSDIGEELIVGLRHIVEPVLSGLVHNVLDQGSIPYIQRFAYSERLNRTSTAVFRDLSHKAATEFVQEMDEWLSENELPPETALSNGNRAGVGVFYFERSDVNES